MLFAVLLGASIVAIWAAIPMLLIMHFLMPKNVLDRYWTTPYFRPAELALFTNTVYAPMRTVMLSWVIAFPRFGRKRGLMEAYRLPSKSYRLACKALGVWIVVWTVSLFASGIGYLIYAQLIGRSIQWVR